MTLTLTEAPLLVRLVVVGGGTPQPAVFPPVRGALVVFLIQEQERPGMDWMERNSQDHFKALIDAEFFHSASYTKYQNKPPSHIKYNFQANSF